MPIRKHTWERARVYGRVRDFHQRDFFGVPHGLIRFYSKGGHEPTSLMICRSCNHVWITTTGPDGSTEKLFFHPSTSRWAYRSKEAVWTFVGIDESPSCERV